VCTILPTRCKPDGARRVHLSEDRVRKIFEDEPVSGYYFTAQVCMNGHATTSRLEQCPESASKFCPDCGTSTISNCPKCKANIRGDYEVPGIAVIGFGYSAPSYCFNCGAAFPWTAERIKTAEELAEEIEELSPVERQQLKDSIADLTKDTSRTELASVRYKKLMRKAGAGVASAMNKIVVAVATEGAKKLLGF
jgi:hypothetical protein